ncbi:MAG TPA: ABC transporter permease [Thermoanaerobaculia bacterium]|nr:ABC transporter permease [Thermoanaerobaculia bacterium]
MVFLENFRLAVSALRANALRSVLTTLGIVIGVAAVIAVVSLIQGLELLLTNQLQGVGATYIMVLPLPQRTQPDTAARQIRLTWEDGQAIRDRLPGVRRITPAIIGQVDLHYRDRRQVPDWVVGINQDGPEVLNLAVDQGRFFSGVDLADRRKVVVVGEAVVKGLKLGSDPIGKEIYVGRYPATVIGVMEKKGQTLGQDLDNMVFLPFGSALTLFGRQAGEQVQLRLQAVSPEAVDEVKDGINRLLRQRHRLPKGEPNDFQILVQDEILGIIRRVFGFITAAVAGVVSIALLVGGIGIMNIMLVSVTERTREIGVRKAMGARKQDILVQFLVEAVALSLIGGAIGLAVGYGMGALTVHLLPGNLPPAHVPLWAVGLAFGFSTLVGVFFGIYPAQKASRLNPIDALHYE